MKNNAELSQAFSVLNEALQRLGEALEQPLSSSPLVLDGSIQRFEFCYELFWKALMKTLLVSEGVEAKSPRQVLSKAFELGWVDDEKTWLDMLADRNLTSHTYQKKLAEQVYAHLPKYYAAMFAVFQKLHP